MATFEEVKQFADKLVKDSKKYEKEEVGLSEKKKHLGAKAKKIKKSVTDVSTILDLPIASSCRIVMK